LGDCENCSLRTSRCHRESRSKPTASLAVIDHSNTVPWSLPPSSGPLAIDPVLVQHQQMMRKKWKSPAPWQYKHARRSRTSIVLGDAPVHAKRLQLWSWSCQGDYERFEVEGIGAASEVESNVPFEFGWAKSPRDRVPARTVKHKWRLGYIITCKGGSRPRHTDGADAVRTTQPLLFPPTLSLLFQTLHRRE